jgi:hypothetical protein
MDSKIKNMISQNNFYIYNIKIKTMISQNNFYIYNYYNIPINVKILCPFNEFPVSLIDNIQPGKKECIGIDLIAKYVTNGSQILIYNAISPIEIIGEAIINWDNNGYIRDIHAGMNTGQYDIAESAEPTKSPLASALPRVRLINSSPRTLKLNYNILIPPKKSFLYYGEYQNGIPLGTILKDFSGVLRDYTINIPVTDIFFGLISDMPVALYSRTRVGISSFTDEGEIVEFPFQTVIGYQYHRGTAIDRTYIPKNW